MSRTSATTELPETWDAPRGQGADSSWSGKLWSRVRKRETFLEFFICLCSKLTPWEPEEGGETATPGDGNAAACAAKV